MNSTTTTIKTDDKFFDLEWDGNPEEPIIFGISRITENLDDIAKFESIVDCGLAEIHGKSGLFVISPTDKAYELLFEALEAEHIEKQLDRLKE